MRYDACLRTSAPFGLSWAAKVAIPTSHPLGRIVRLERIIGQVEVEAPEHGGWLGKRVKLRTQWLDRLHLTELCVSPDARLRSAADGTGGGPPA
jgi:hypothetical protein